jgi:putative pyrroloquinoline-quinone binding quinoprotein/putative pyrroloquinoline-quinone-binding quinoprotein
MRLNGLSALCLVAACETATKSPSTDSSAGNTPPVVADGHDWIRFNVDEGRSGVFNAPTGITADSIASMRRQEVTLDGTVDAAPIYLHGVTVGGAHHDVFFVTTTYGKTIAIDANDGSILWEFTPPNYSQWAGSYRITTATPVADPDRSAIYAASPDGRIQKLAVADGHVAWSTPITLLPTREKIASALNFSRGHVIAVTGGYIGDAPPYQGHVVLLDAGTGSLVRVWNSLCSDRSGLIDPSSCASSGSAIWGRAGAVVDSTTGNILVATGNATWDGQKNWGDAVLAVDAAASRLVANYTPSNTETLNSTDADIGSTSPVILDATHILQGGKDGRLRTLDLQAIGNATPHRGGELASVSTPSGSGLFTAPAVWRRSDGVWIFAADNGGTAGYTYRDGALTKVWSATTAGTSPVIAGGTVFVYDPAGALRVFEPTTGKVLGQLALGSGHWNSPIVVDRRIALPQGNANAHSTSGVLNIWRLP